MSVLNTPADPRHKVENPMDSGWYRTLPLAGVILGFVLVAANYTSLPDSIPMHFNARGEVDDYGPKLLLWILPALNLGLFVLVGWAATTDFKWFNYPVTITEENAAEQHRIGLWSMALIRVITCLMLAYIVFAIVQSAVAEESRLNMAVLSGFLIALFGSIGLGLKMAFAAK